MFGGGASGRAGEGGAARAREGGQPLSGNHFLDPPTLSVLSLGGRAPDMEATLTMRGSWLLPFLSSGSSASVRSSVPAARRSCVQWRRPETRAVKPGGEGAWATADVDVERWLGLLREGRRIAGGHGGGCHVLGHD